MKTALAQIKSYSGDFDKNCEQVLEILKRVGHRADLVVFPEGGLWGYPPKDFLYQSAYFKLQEKKIRLINKHLEKELGLILPAFVKSKGQTFNGVFFLEKNKPAIFFAKEFLPDQGVFFESRYFTRGQAEKNFFQWKGLKIQMLICEDLWQARPQGVRDLLIAVNASPYTDQKQKLRLQRMRALAKQYKCPSIYLNRVGGQDSLIFDGGSFALSRDGNVIWQGAFFQPDFKILNIPTNKSQKAKNQKTREKNHFLSLPEQRERALILGIKDFFLQTGFSKAIVGLSGGIDSALAAYLAIQALGKHNIQAYFLPGPHTQNISFKIVRQLKKNLDIPVIKKDIASLFNSFSKRLFDKSPALNPLTPQNLQARLRMLALMSFANESSSLLLATGNKSEMLTGYSTLYGDLSGALCPIGDLLKTQVYELAHFINKRSPVFPKSLFLREPSAELAPEQKDRDDLPPYSRLDPMLKKALKNQPPQSPREKKIRRLIQAQEFKRAQAPPILKISERDLGDSWKYPIAHKFPI